MDTAERDSLILEHMPQVERIAARLKIRLPSHVDIEELEADGYVGLVRAASRWDPTRGLPFGSYAWWNIRGEMIEGLRRTYRQLNPALTVSLGALREEDEVFRDEAYLEPEKKAAEARLDAASILALLTRSNNSHGQRQARLLTARHLEGRTQADIAGQMGVTRARVSQLCAEARHQARRVATTDEHG
ncbi:hypothetical protein LCGC14_3092120 [marine sediment metagenome]|uniref:RNA polymerase sigma-70 region 2 domain-containing protein n=1 Tax=marine sediment metagenome TaxID=412755 RepID=A0A0F8WZ02_9ZZZZ